MENIYTQAVADAKAVRESAMANAKAAIQEAFEPKIKAMLRKHIVESEMDYKMAEDVDMEDDPERVFLSDQDPTGASFHGHMINCSPKFLKDLIGEPQYSENDGSGDYNYMWTCETEGGEVFVISDDNKGTPLSDNQQVEWLIGAKNGRISGKAKAAIQSYMDMNEEEADEIVNIQDGTPSTAIDETSLDEILAELDALEEGDSEEADELNEAEEEEEKETEEETEEDEDGEEESEESTEETKVVDITLGDLVDAIKAAMASEAPAPETGGEETADDDISLDAVLKELEEEMEETTSGASGDIYEAKKKKAKEEEEKKAEKELEEAKKAIETMRAELNEVNLLNAKLLYVNKIFKSKSLTEAQKVKVLNAFDKATTVKEVKNTYSIISESMTAAPKKQLKESYGFASKPAGVAPKANTVESDPFIARMQKLAGL